MKNQKPLILGVFTAIAFICLQSFAVGQTANDGKLASVSGGGSSVRWDLAVQTSGASLTISAPDGRVFHKDYRAGTSPEINLSDKQLDGLPDGTYTYELRLRP